MNRCSTPMRTSFNPLHDDGKDPPHNRVLGASLSFGQRLPILPQARPSLRNRGHEYRYHQPESEAKDLHRLEVVRGRCAHSRITDIRDRRSVGHRRLSRKSAVALRTFIHDPLDVARQMRHAPLATGDCRQCLQSPRRHATDSRASPIHLPTPAAPSLRAPPSRD